MERTNRKSIKALALLCIAILMLLITIFTPNIMQASAIKESDSEQRQLICEASLEDDFADDRVTVVLTKEATRKFLNYTLKSFPEVDAVAVEDLTSLVVDWVKKQILGIPTKEKKLINVEEFRRILSIRLSENSKENVLSAVKILEQREDIQSANPSFAQTISAQPDDPNFINGG